MTKPPGPSFFSDRMRLPEWLRTERGKGLHDTKKFLRSLGVSTVCEEARCPNIGKCFSKPSAAFMILGSRCTRNCGFCAVESSLPEAPDSAEPEKVAMAARKMGLRYVVLTSVTRDDLVDGGAGQFAKTVRAVKSYLPSAKIEVLTPDFGGNPDDLMKVLDARPHVYNHNVETVPRLYPHARPLADYRRSVSLLEYAKKTAPDIRVKSGLMLGLGESMPEVYEVLADLRSSGCDVITIGQYMRPSRVNLPVAEYVKPETFERLRQVALSMGFSYVASAPLVRSSMNAEEMYNIR
ncbi:MAG TPA: lipoyl synthase [Thermodesulfovibrionales bacterium]|nr:lipoyl synthase [Thermodesulfovibrionales bacterium]